MISVEEARRIIVGHASPMGTEMCALEQSAGRYLARTVTAPWDHPLFDASAVDGYALGPEPGSAQWTLVGEVPPGSVFAHTLGTGEAVRVFTGASVPQGTVTVVMQEFVQRQGDRITQDDPRPVPGGNIRRRGEQLRQGGAVIPSATMIDAAAVGLLASVGVSTVEVARLPRVAILVTGDEFTVQQPPAPGRIFSSNDALLAALLHGAGVPARSFHAGDRPTELRSALEEAMQEHDVVITTGGASVGDHDLVERVLLEIGARIHFHGVAQKPGKPMLFATARNKPVFGLPGNPRAVFVLYMEYVLPFLRAMQGALAPGPRQERLPLAHAVSAKGQRAEFRAAAMKDGRVTLLADEGSHMLRSLVGADALVYLPAHQREWRIGDLVEIHPLPR